MPDPIDDDLLILNASFFTSPGHNVQVQRPIASPCRCVLERKRRSAWVRWNALLCAFFCARWLLRPYDDIIIMFFDHSRLAPFGLYFHSLSLSTEIETYDN